MSNIHRVIVVMFFLVLLASLGILIKSLSKAEDIEAAKCEKCEKSGGIPIISWSDRFERCEYLVNEQ